MLMLMLIPPPLWGSGTLLTLRGMPPTLHIQTETAFMMNDNVVDTFAVWSESQFTMYNGQNCADGSCKIRNGQNSTVA